MAASAAGPGLGSVLSAALERYGRAGVLALLAITVALLLVKPIALLSTTISLIYNEGWNAYYAARAFLGDDGPLYPEPGALITNNYPPLSFYVVGGLGELIGDNIVAGRLVALLSLLLVAVNVGLIVRRVSASATGAAFAGLLLVGYVVIRHEQYAATNDAQWLAHAFMTSGLVVFLGGGGGTANVAGRGRHRYGRTVAAAALMLAGGLVKHNLVALPLAITIWLFVYDRRRGFVVWLAASAVLLAAALAILTLVHGTAFLAGVFGTPRSYQPAVVAIGLDLWVSPLLPLIGAALVLFLLDRRDPAVQLITLYAVLALLWGVFTSVGKGVYYNAFFELIVALAIAAGCLVGRLRDRPAVAAALALDRSRVQLVALALLALMVLLPAPRTLGKAALFLVDLGAVRARAAEDIAFVAARDGPALCETLALCYWAGKPFAMDFSNAGEKLDAGVIDRAALIELIAGHHFATIQLEALDGDVPARRRLSPEVVDAIAAHYVIGRTSPESGVLLVPGSKDG